MRTMKDKGTDEWGTPRLLFEQLDREFNFTLDPCGTSKRILKKDMITLDIRNGEDGIGYCWGDHRVFVNPPYSRNKIQLWCKKAFAESCFTEVIVLLLPLNIANNKYFHEYIYPFKKELRILRGRTKFVPLNCQKTSSPTFGCMVVVI